jgi:hypothetical protein
VADSQIEAAGVSLADYSAQIAGGWLEKKRLTDGYVALHLGNLSTISLKPQYFDVAYSYQVLRHNQVITPIIENVMSALRAGGVYYFDTLVEQQEEVDVLAKSLAPTEWHIQSETLTVQSMNSEDICKVHKII